jgi:hypothetical protein
MKSLMAPRKMLDASQHLDQPARRLCVLERLVRAAAAAEAGGAHLFEGEHNSPDRREDFFGGLSEIIGDVRRGLNALSDFDFDSYEPSADESEMDRSVRQLLREAEGVSR